MTAARLSPDVGRLARCAVVFEPADPPRAGTVAFWDKGFGQPPDGVGRAAGLTVVTQDDGGVTTREVPAVRFAVGDALALLSRARTVDGAHPASVFWGAATVVALQLVARGRMLPGVSPGDHDAWRAGPLDADDVDRLRGLAASMPPEARAVPVPGTDPVEVSDAEALVRAYLDAVADGMPRSAAAAAAAGSPVFAAPEPQHVPGLRRWAQEVAAGLDAGVRVSLRLEMDEDDPDVPGVTAVVGVHSLADPTLVVDATDLPHDLPAFGPRPRIDTMLAVRRAARVWPPLIRLLEGTVPDRVELSDSEVGDLLDGGAARLIAAGVDVHWPRTLARSLTTRAVVGAGSPPSDLRSVLGSDDAWMRLDWQVALGGDPLTEAEMEALAEAHRPVVRLRDRWVLVDPAVARRARERRLGPLTPIAALGAALSGTVDVAGTPVEVATSGWLEALRARITDDDGDDDVAPPAALDATLREYQVRGMRWLARMTSLGLGGCLADDMGLGKTITLIALHLHRQADPSSTGPTLVVCPASLLGNWEREVERFAPGTGVGRFHGTGRSIDDVLAGVGDGFVLTTYGTMRRDAALLATRTWGLVVADEAQHVKNPMSGTAKALRRIGSVARVALTGTPVENNLSDLWAILDWTTPGLLGTLPAFRARWATRIEEGDRAAAERFSHLVSPFLLRRRKSDPGIAPELPPKTETDQPVSLTAEQAGLYEAVVRETLRKIAAASGMERRGMVLALITALKQVCNHPAQYLSEQEPRMSGRSGKLELLDELVDTILAEGGALLVFTQYVSMARLLDRHLASRGVATQLLHGGTPVRRRDEMVQRFQDGEAPVFLLSLKAAGTGLNLTRADHVVHYDRWWNPAVEDQATDRAYRIGQTRPVQVHRMITEGTIEDRVAQMLAAKRELADAVLAGGESALTELSDADLAELVTLRRRP